jgi:stearoyl-CoA desaturase (Delta-9 desaturase)
MKTHSAAEQMTTQPTTTQPTRKTSTVAATPSQKVTLLDQLGMTLVIVIPLCLAIYAAVTLTHGKVLWWYPVGALLTASLTNLGTTAGYHRMLAHQSFRAHPVVQYALLILGSVAGMDSPVIFAHGHLYHHSNSDMENDLHSPHTPRYSGRPYERLRQWAHAHMGWMFRDQPTQITAKARQITDTPAARFVHKTTKLWFVAGLVLPLCFGWNAFVWFGAVRLFLNHHITWSVNSICHMWGQQPFKNTKDKSKNNVIVGIFALGEGWHNNHHFRPASARHGLLPGQLDLTYLFICLLERCKLASHVKRYVECPDCRDWHLQGLDHRTLCSQRRSVA